jgi:hypothetical protein
MAPRVTMRMDLGQQRDNQKTETMTKRTGASLLQPIDDAANATGVHPEPASLASGTTDPWFRSGRDQYTVAAFNALVPPALAWVELSAHMDMTDMCGQQIKAGDRYFRREIISSGQGSKEYDRLAFPSMALHLKMTFGGQDWFLSNCKHAAKTREAARLDKLRDTMERSAARHGQGQA